MRKIFIIWNPASGGKSSKILKELVEYLDAANLHHTIAETQKDKSATEILEEKLDTSFTDLIIIGGDGTINEAINGLKFDLPVGIIPAGTGDDFVKMVELGSSLTDKINTAVHGEVMQMDLGICNDRKFINGIGIGFDGQIVEDMISKRVSLLKGHAAYYYHVLRILGGYREKKFSYQLDQHSFEKHLILLTIGNGSTFGGGFKLMPQAKINDGLLEVCEIGKISGLKRFLNIHKLSNGTHGKLRAVNHYQASRVKVTDNPLLFGHIDGERLGNPPFDIEVLPNSLKIRVCTK